MDPLAFIDVQLKESVQILQAIRMELQDVIWKSAQMMLQSFQEGGKILVCGNGGSAADAQHFAAELVGRLQRDRKALPAIALTTDTSILTAVGNDYGFDKIFQKQVEAFGVAGDILVAISTSGNSANVIEAINAAKEQGMSVISLTGKSGGDMLQKSDLSLVMPSQSSQHIQEGHIAIIHIWCALIEDAMFPPE